MRKRIELQFPFHTQKTIVMWRLLLLKTDRRLLTDDVLNSSPIPPADGYNILQKTTNPNGQDGGRINLKYRDTDENEAIIAKDYA